MANVADEQGQKVIEWLKDNEYDLMYNNRAQGKIYGKLSHLKSRKRRNEMNLYGLFLYLFCFTQN